VGAVVVQLPDVSGSAVTGAEVAVGVVAAFVSGLWAIRFLLRVISTRGLTGFAVYVALLAGAVLVVPRLS
jgi:undecaprenyl-diphosphatase